LDDPMRHGLYIGTLGGVGLGQFLLSFSIVFGLSIVGYELVLV
jgi:hypothetical protein